ncbi:MAG: hypothetical protein EZS28_009891 [Streblomastix strix]|uniref:Uncharacterized protein n=1 Tax=Streblomastix strix TaxID=222440 RepID=A0A5J4WHZ0_9EUKA|nr:MAG: hypothetical protein EZS28_009891 [Streblomastix strix]
MNMMMMTRRRVKQLFDADKQVMLAERSFHTSTFSYNDEDYMEKMNYLCRRVLDKKQERQRDKKMWRICLQKRSYGAAIRRIQSRDMMMKVEISHHKDFQRD